MDTSVKPDAKPDAPKPPLVGGYTGDSTSAKVNGRGAAKKAPLLTGHSTHDELLEKARIERGIHSYGHGIPVFPQYMIYLIGLAIILVLIILFLVK